MKGDIIRFSVLGIVLAIAGGGLYYQYQNSRPCTRPISYAIGAVDARFGITKSALISDTEVAAAIWNKAMGKTLLAYDPNAALKISFIYDEREASAKLGAKILQQQEDLDSARAALDAEQSRFVTEQSAYNQTVKTINARGGATPSEARDLSKQQESLKQLADSINNRVASFNTSVTALNAVTAEYNQNTGHTFEQGKYVRDSAGERISIFEFIGEAQLKRVLAHEFGHAIGLDHNNDSKSIMFAKNESGNLVPTQSDLSALQAVCGT